MEKLFKEKKFIILFATISCFLWGSAFPSLKAIFISLNLSNNDFNSKVLLAGYRFFIASIIVFFITKFVFHKSLKIKKEDSGKLIMLGILNTSLMYFFFYNGLANVDGMKAPILSVAGNFFVVILAHFIYKNDTLDKRKIIGLILGFLGIIVINWSKGFSFSFTFTGEGFMLISALLNAISTIVAKSFSKKINTLIITAYQLLFGSIVMIVYGLTTSGASSLNFDLGSFSILIYTSFISAIAFSIWFTLLKYNKAGIISIFKFMIPIFGSFLIAIFFPEETFSLSIILGLLLVSMGIVIISYKVSFNSEEG